MNRTLRETTPTWVLNQNHDHSIKNRLKTIKNEYSDSHFHHMILNQQILANTPNQWDPCHNNKNHRIFHVSYERSAYIFNMRARSGPSKLESEYGLSVNYPTKINNKPNTKLTEISTSFSHKATFINNIKGITKHFTWPSAIFKIRAPLRPMQNHETRRILTSQQVFKFGAH